MDKIEKAENLLSVFANKMSEKASTSFEWDIIRGIPIFKLSPFPYTLVEKIPRRPRLLSFLGPRRRHVLGFTPGPSEMNHLPAQLTIMDRRLTQRIPQSELKHLADELSHALRQEVPFHP